MHIFLDLEKYLTDLLTPQTTKGVNYQPKKYIGPFLIYTAGTPLE